MFFLVSTFNGHISTLGQFLFFIDRTNFQCFSKIKPSIKHENIRQYGSIYHSVLFHFHQTFVNLVPQLDKRKVSHFSRLLLKQAHMTYGHMDKLNSHSISIYVFKMKAHKALNDTCWEHFEWCFLWWNYWSFDCKHWITRMIIFFWDASLTSLAKQRHLSGFMTKKISVDFIDIYMFCLFCLLKRGPYCLICFKKRGGGIFNALKL